jgi:O-antigen/teichoic acid export membrane protein
MLTFTILRQRAIDLLAEQKTFLSNFLVMNIGSMIVMLLNFSMLTYLGRTLGLSMFGLYSLGLAVTTTLMPIVDMGLPTFGTRELARDKSNAGILLISITALRISLSVIVFLATLFVASLVISSPQKEVIILSCVW